MSRFILLAAFTVLRVGVQAQGPEVTCWILNTSNATGYSGIPSNVQEVQYSGDNVYVSCTCIPGYDIGPWAGNPNTPANQDFTFRISRSPVQNTGTATETSLGHIGVWRNGVSIFNARDAFSYNNQGIWNQDALPNEGLSFDECLGHPAPNGEYHHHVNPTCLYDDDNSTVHSPLIGYAFDSFPIYGAYGYANPDATGGIVRMESSYQLREISDRTTLPDGTPLQPSQYGPAISSAYPLGKYLEDYEYVPGLGHLDAHNGRWCITPDYPQGTYAYFVTVAEDNTPVYPYTVGPTYYGVVTPGNTGPQSGHTSPGANEEVEVWDGNVAFVHDGEGLLTTMGPNPASHRVSLESTSPVRQVKVFSATGQSMLCEGWNLISGAVDVSGWETGTYFVRVTTDTASQVLRLSVVH